MCSLLSALISICNSFCFRLEYFLRSYAVLSKHQTIQFWFNDVNYSFDVTETHPGVAIDINEIDLEVSDHHPCRPEPPLLSWTFSLR